VGIVTRPELVRAFSRSDEEVPRDVRERVAQAALWLDENEVEVRLDEGEAVLTGRVRSRGDAEALSAIAAGVPGVVNVRSELSSSGES
jgi:osmotically-inducible protein OsmY